MKKLALALMCLVSIAFFASCDPEGQPSISAYIEEGYVQDGDVVNVADEVYFGFVVASSPITNNKLATLVVKIDDQEWETVEFDGETEYTYKDSFSFEAKEIIGETTITAVVTDVAGQTATASITLSVEENDEPLIASTFDWSRKGLTLESEEEMAAVGLTWPGNYRDDVFVTIKPLAGCSMYIIEDGDEFDAIKTEGDRDSFFAELTETATPDTQYKEISAYHNGTYNTMLAVVDADGEYHLVRFNRATTEMVTAGALIHLFGELK